MIRKSLLVFLIILIFFSMACVHASENETFNCTNDLECYLTVSDFNYENIDSSFEDNILGKTYSISGGKFSDIQNIIDKANSGDTIRLSGTFKADDTDSIIKINKKLNIISKNGAVLNGKDISGIFSLSKKI